ncbi:hypothetical protein ACXJJ3_08860 [Kribbella sp. WER1]|uniref:hypothetical protein n=1 Tax=Kribbella sp. NPDC059898 TaxID=3346995 RepID=UPI00365F650A
MTNDFNDALTIAEQRRRHSVRTAVMFIVQDQPHCALAELLDSVHRCAHLDHRPLDPVRVLARANNLLAEWGNPRPCLELVA